MERTDELKERIRQQPLNDRLEESRRRIGDMCSKGRCPKMTIPVQHDDDDFYINTTLADAQATIAALQLRVQELEQPVYVCQGCGRLGRDGWLPTSFTSDELRGSVQCPDCGCIDQEKNTARELAAICTKAQSELTQRTAQLTQLDRTLADVYAQRDGLQKDLEQRTAELEAVKADTKNMLDVATSRLREQANDIQAELERVRGELVEAAHNANVYQSLYSTGCMDRALLENDLRDLRTLILALPKVEGEIEVYTGKNTNQVVVTYNRGIIIGTLYGLDHAKPIAALYEHRQGMEG